MSSLAEVDQLYKLLNLRGDQIRSLFGRIPTVRDLPKMRNGWRTKGVYFLFDATEKRAGKSNSYRIVRVGSHSGELSSIESRIVGEHATDWGRSVLRRLMGAALIRRGDLDHTIEVAERDRWAKVWYSKDGQWAVQHNPAKLHPTLHPLHPIVTRIISDMGVLWVEVADRVERLELEKQCIMLLSNSLRSHSPIDPPTKEWLGNYSLSEKVRTSGLWNQQHVKKLHAKGFLDHFAKQFRE